MPFEQLKDFTREKSDARSDEEQLKTLFKSGDVDDLNAEAGENARNIAGGFNGSVNDSVNLENAAVKNVEGENAQAKNSVAESTQTEYSGGFGDDEYYGFKKALDEFNEELKNEINGATGSSYAENQSADFSEKSAYKPVNDTFAENLVKNAETENEVKPEITAGEKSAANDLTEKAKIENETIETKTIETKAEEKADGENGVDKSRYLSEFNEFKYARYMGAVVADMRKVYSPKEVAAALNDFEKDKFSAYCVNLRQIKAVKEFLDKNKKQQTALSKRSAKAVVGASAYVKKTGDAGGFGVSGRAKLFGEKVKVNQPKICVFVGDESGSNALCLAVREVKYARKNGASEIDIYVSPESVLAPDHKTLKNEIKALKRAAGKATLKIGVNLNVLTDLQAETLMSVSSSLKITSFIVSGSGAAEKIKRLKSFVPHCKIEITSSLKTTGELNEALDFGADRVYTTEFIPLAVCVRRDLEKVQIK